MAVQFKIRVKNESGSTQHFYAYVGSNQGDNSSDFHYIGEVANNAVGTSSVQLDSANLSSSSDTFAVYANSSVLRSGSNGGLQDSDTFLSGFTKSADLKHPDGTISSSTDRRLQEASGNTIDDGYADITYPSSASYGWGAPWKQYDSTGSDGTYNSGNELDAAGPEIQAITLHTQDSTSFTVKIQFDEKPFVDASGTEVSNTAPFSTSSIQWIYACAADGSDFGGSSYQPCAGALGTSAITSVEQSYATTSVANDSILVKFNHNNTANGNERFGINVGGSLDLFDAYGNKYQQPSSSALAAVYPSQSGSNGYVQLADQSTDSTAPTISSISCSADNTQLTVTFSEDVYNSNGGSGELEASDFAVTISGGNASHSGAPTAISKTSQKIYVLTLGNGSRLDEATGGETVSVDSASDTSIYDAAGNAHTAAATTYLKVRAPVSLSVSQSTPTAPQVTVTFARSMYNTNGASGNLEVSDFVVSMTGGKATMSSGAPAAIARTSQSVWVLTLPTVTNGASANGHEVVTVAINGDSAVFDPDGNGIDASEFVQNTIRLSQQIDTDQTSGFIGFADIRAHKDHFAAMTGKGIQLKDGGVTLAKMADLANDRILGNVSGADAAPAAITLQTSGTLNGTADQLADNAVIKAYVDAQVGGASLEFTADSGDSQSLDLDGASLDIEGGDGVATTASEGKVSVAIDAKANGGLVIESNKLAVKLDASSISGTLAVGDGGTGATTASAARTALGLAIGSDVQAYDAQLADIAGLTPTDGNIIIGDGSNFVLESGATARASLGLTIGTHVQAYDAQLADIAGLTPTDGNIIIGDGSNFVLESGATARASLGLTIGTHVQAYDAQLADVAGLTPGDGKFIVGDGSNFTVEDGATARASLGLTIGTHVQAFDAQLSDVAGLTPTDSGFIVGNGSNFVVETGATLRTSMGVGTTDSPQLTGIEVGHASDTTLARASAGDISVEGNIVYRAGGTDVPLTDGGTGASTASAARTNLGLAIGTDVQAYDDQLADVAGLAVTDGGVIVGNGSNFVLESGATLRTSLGLGTGDTPTFAGAAMGSNKITGLAAPEDDSDAATKVYVDNLIEGISAKTSVVAASTGNVTIATLDAGQSLDGVTLALNDRVLLKDQTDASENGIYKINADNSAATRVEDMAAASSAAGIFVFVEGGSTHPDQGFLCSSDKGSDVVGTNDLTFVQFSSAGVSTAGDGLDKTGNQFSIDAKANGGLVIEGGELAVKLDASSITGTLAVGDGGTGATTAGAARTALGLAIGSDVQAYDAQLADIAGLTPTDGNIIIGDGSNFVLESGATARASLGLTIGTHVQAYDAQLADIAGLSPTDGNIIIGDGSNFVLESGATARASLGLTIGTHVQAYDAQLADVAGLTPTDGNVIIGDGSNFVLESGATLRTSIGVGTGDSPQFTGIEVGHASDTTLARASAGDISVEGKVVYRAEGTDVPVSDGGTGASTAAQARTNLGLAIGSDVQAYDAQLADVAGLTPGDGKFIVGDGSNFVVEDGATARASLGLTIGTHVQAYDAQLADIAGLSPTDGNIIIGDGSNFVLESGATARASLGLTIGTHVQAYDAGLASIAGLTTAEDKMIYTSGSDTYAVTSLTSAGRALLDDASASAQRDTLGLQPKIQFFAPGNYPSSLGSQQALTLDVAVTAQKSCIVFVNGTAIMMALDSSGDPIATQLSAGDSEKYHVSGTTLTLGSDVIDDLDQDFVIVWYMA